MERGLFTFAVDDPRVHGYWSDDRLTGREAHLTKHLKEAKLAPERVEDIHRELGHLAFEKWHRRDAKKTKEEEIAWMEHGYQPSSWVLDE